MHKNIKNDKYIGALGKLGAIDLTTPETYSGKLIVFAHGFMGYKDWGCWNLVENYFTLLGFAFCKYNVSHNGCSIDKPREFINLEAFGHNNYSKELDDIKGVLNWVQSKLKPQPEIYFIGHSRSGATALLSHGDTRIKKLALWAPICSIKSRFPSGQELQDWKSSGVRYQINSRTKQELPLYFSQFEDFLQNQDALNIQKAALKCVKPVLVIHGEVDSSVDIQEGANIAKWLESELITIANANHTFGSSEPWNKEELPKELNKVCRLTAEFFLLSNHHARQI